MHNVQKTKGGWEKGLTLSPPATFLPWLPCQLPFRSPGARPVFVGWNYKAGIPHWGKRRRESREGKQTVMERPTICFLLLLVDVASSQPGFVQEKQLPRCTAKNEQVVLVGAQWPVLSLFVGYG